MKRLAIACLALVAAAAGPAIAANAPPAMIAPGQFNVSAAGAATYTIPIVVPPGSAGMVPALSLDYSSQSGDGIEGIGWTLSGLPSISRCPRTIAQDGGVHGSVNYDSDDRFCMEGQRLILISGTYGADGSQYRTEIESFSEIIAHGSAGSGPAWFEVHTKAGQIMEFGNTVDSRILTVDALHSSPTPTARAWAVNKISDTVGNYLTVTYNCAPSSGVCTDSNRTTLGEAYPEEVDYTGNASAGGAPYNSLKFIYTGRTDTVPVYQAGMITQTNVVMTDIKTYQASNLVSDYQLGYRAGATVVHSRLTSVTLCDASSNCLAPTTFSWQGGTAQQTVVTTNITVTPGGQYTIPGDFNGDGLTDYTYVTNRFTDCPPYPVYLGTETPGFVSSSYTLTNGAAGNTSCFVTEPGGTILAPNGTAAVSLGVYGNLVLYFSGLTTAGPINITQSSSGVGTNFALQSPNPGDFNGDGIPDFFLQYQTSAGSIFYIGDQYGGFSTTPDANLSSLNTTVATADFDGDGCIDLDAQAIPGTSGGTTNIIYSTFCHPAIATSAPPSSPGLVPQFGDFNGDGKTDVLLYDPNGFSASLPSQLWLSTGTDFVEVNSSLPVGLGDMNIGDVNGDGKTDVSGPDANPAYDDIYLSTGTGFTQALDSSNNPIINFVYSPTDWNNDGVADGRGGTSLQPAIISFDYAPELMTGVSNGIGATTTITYDRINKNGSFYQKCSNGTYACGDTYPIQSVDGPLYVVSRVDASNGLGTCPSNCYSSTYAYAFAKTDLEGRGFLGFGRVTITDLQTNIVQTTNYSQSFPYTGLISDQTKTHSGTTLSSVTNTLKDNTDCQPSAPSTGVYVVCITESATVSNDLNGAAFPTVTTDYTYDDYGNALTVDVAVSDGSSKDTTNTYSNDTTNWFLGRLLTTSVNSIVGASNLTRQSSFAYDSGTGLLTEETIEPGVSTCNSGSSSCTLSTSYTYDAFGHRIATTVFGTGITTRTSYAAYDSLGEFQTSATNALGQQESWSYDARFGGPTAHAGPNFLTTLWSYDSFGRMTLQTGADGTKTSVSYAYCSGVNGGAASCPPYGSYLAQSEMFAADGTTQIGPVSANYYDSLSRPIATDAQGFSGSNIRVATQYDADGRVLETSRPYFTDSASPAWTTFIYDALGRVTEATFPDSSHTTYGFNGLVTTATNNLSQTTTTTKNTQGLTASVEDAASHTTTYVYDGFSDLVTVTDPASNTITNAYDIRGNKISSNDPDLGSWNYAYDVLSELISQTDNKSQTTTLAYDLLGRPLSRTEPGLYSAWSFGTSAGSHNVGKEIEAKACTASGCGTVVTDRTFAYDLLGRPQSNVLHTGGSDYGYTQSYNTTNGKLAGLTYPSGLVVQYLYNMYGYQTELTDAQGSLIWRADARDAEMHLLSQLAGNGVATTQAFDPLTGLIENQRAGGGAVASFDYSFDTIGNLTARTDNDESYTERFCYDALNRLTDANIGSACTGGKTATYDSIGNITTKSDAGTYSYPSSGSARPHAVASIAGTVDGLTDPQYSYDANGNMTCVSSGAACSGTIGRSITTTSFNMAAGLIQGSTSLSLTYDDQHQRIEQVSTVSGTTTTTVYLNDPATGAMSEQVSTAATTPSDWGSFDWGGAPWGGTTPSTVPTFVDYIQADGQIVAQRSVQYQSGSLWGFENWGSFDWGPPAGGSQWGGFNWGAANWTGPLVTWAYFTLDHLGSVAVITDQGGNATQRLSYDAWGKQRNANGTDASCGAITSSTTRGFTNQEQMPAACLVNLNARIYDPSIGRFMAPDSLVPDPFNGQSFNRFSYVTNNPLSLIDPSGHDGAHDTGQDLLNPDLDYDIAGCLSAGAICIIDIGGEPPVTGAPTPDNLGSLSFSNGAGNGDSFSSGGGSSSNRGATAIPHPEGLRPLTGKGSASLYTPTPPTPSTYAYNPSGTPKGTNGLSSACGANCMNIDPNTYNNGDCALYGCGPPPPSTGQLNPSVGATVPAFGIFGGTVDVGSGSSYLGGGIVIGGSGKVDITGGIAAEDFTFGSTPQGPVINLDVTIGNGVLGGNFTLYGNSQGISGSLSYQPSVGASLSLTGGYLTKIH